MSTIFLDVETIPDMRPGALDAFIADTMANFKAPSTLTKEQAANDLGMTDPGEIKYTSKDAMIAKWEARFREEKAAAVAEQEWRKTSFDGGRGQLAVFGLAFEDEAPLALWSGDYVRDEAAILREAFGLMERFHRSNNMHRPCIVGHNHIAFDLRFIWHRAVILGVKPPIWWPHNARPWDTDVVFDTMAQWAGIGNRISMVNLCAALGIPGKTEGMDGSQVWDAVKDGRIAEVADYCKGDVRRTRDIYRKMTFSEAL